MTAVTVSMEVPFHDVDSLRVVWHGHYVKYLEIARTALFRAAGLDTPFFIANELVMVVIECRCRYKRPLRLGETFRVQAMFDAPTASRIAVKYRVHGEDGLLCTLAHTDLAVTTFTGQVMHPIPEVVLARITDYS